MKRSTIEKGYKKVGKRSLYITLLYVSIVVSIVLSALLLYGLTLHYQTTVSLIDTISEYVVIVIVAIIAWHIVKYARAYHHEQVMKREERALAVQTRVKLAREASIHDAEIEKIQADAYLKRTEARARWEEMLLSQRKADIELQAMNTRLQLETQQGSIYRVSVNESMYVLENGGSFKQVVQGQFPPTRVSIPARAHTEVSQVALPLAPTFARMQGLIGSKDNLVLGYTESKPLYGTLEDHLLSMLFTGRPKTGKSTALLYYSAMFLKVGTLPIILDPQGSLQELEGVLPYRNSMQSIHEFIPLLYDEFTERENMWRRGRMLKPYSIVVIIDELPMIAAWEEQYLTRDDKYTVSNMIQKIILELRKLLVYVLVAGQGFPYTVMPTLTRENTSSRLIFPTTERYAKMAGLQDKHIKTMLPLLDAVDRGTGILDVSCEKEPKLINIPFTTVDDLIQQISGNELYQDIIARFSRGVVIESDTPRAPIQEQIAQYKQQAVTPDKSVYVRNALDEQVAQYKQRTVTPMDSYTKQVYDTCKALLARGERCTVTNVWKIIHGDKSRISSTIKKLHEQGHLTHGENVASYFSPENTLDA